MFFYRRVTMNGTLLAQTNTVKTQLSSNTDPIADRKGRIMQTSPRIETRLNREQIAAIAYSLWEKGGRQPGHDLEYWLKAENDFQGGKQQDGLQRAHPAPKPPVMAHGTAGTRRSGNGNSGE
jgi:hypothetical protein